MAIDITQTLSDIAPELCDVDNSKKCRFIELAKLRINASAFGTGKYELAVAYLAAHDLTLSERTDGESRGSLKREREGDLEIEYSDVDTQNPGSTKYLDQFDKLIKTCIFAPRTRCQ